jgi:inner membrane protein
VLGVVYGIWRLRGRPIKNPALPPRWGLLFLFAYIAGLSHILLDFTNNYGVRPFWPFWEKWYSWDIVFIVEPLLWIALTAGLVVPGFFALIGQEVGERRPGLRGRTAAILALAAMVLLWGVRDFEHRRAVAALRASSYDGTDLVRVGAYPTYINPFTWHGVVETRNFYGLAEVNSLSPEFYPPGKMEIRYKPEETAITLAAKRSYLGRVYLDWAAFPITQTTSTAEGGWLVEFQDLRFEQPLRIGGRHPLSAGVLLDRAGKVQAEFMGLGPQPAPD